jgi:hypothetical protein
MVLEKILKEFYPTKTHFKTVFPIVAPPNPLGL